MRVIGYALDLLGYTAEKEEIFKKWKSLHSITPYELDDAFELAYPKVLLELYAVQGLEAVKGIGCVVASKSNNGVIFNMLNQAWDKFWEDAENYFIWESEKLEHLI